MAKALLFVVGVAASRNEGTTMLQTGRVAERLLASGGDRVERLASMKERVLSFVENGVPEETKPFLQQIRGLLETEVWGTLVDEVNHAHEQQTNFSTLPFEAASATYNTDMTSPRGTEATDVGNKKAAHMTCRGLESTDQVELNTCNGELQTKTNTFNSAVSGVLGLSSDHELCEAPGWASEDIIDLRAYEAQVGAVITARDEMDTKTTECGGLTTDHTNKKGDCDGDQSTYEQAACQLALNVQAAATKYDNAYNLAVGNLGTLKSTLSGQSDDRIHQCKTVKTIVCYVNALENNNAKADLTAAIGLCDGGMDTVDCSAVTFTGVDAPAAITTDAKPATACDDGFEYLTTEVTAWPQFTTSASPECCVEPTTE